MVIAQYIVFGIGGLILYLWGAAITAQLFGKVLKMRRLELEAETEEVVGKPVDWRGSK